MRAVLLALAALIPRPYAVTAPRLWHDYRTDEAAAKAKYEGRRLSVFGTVTRVSATFTLYLNGEDPSQSVGVTAVPGDHQYETLGKYHVGDSVFLTCTGAGTVFGEPILLDCSAP